jgi:hypothetical protein
MRILTGLLFLTGFFWAFLLWPLLLVPVINLLGGSRLQNGHWFMAISGAVLAAVGYFIWLGWGTYALTGRYPGERPRLFWLASLALHSAWLLFIAAINGQSSSPCLMSDVSPLILVWIFGNIGLAILVIFAKEG